MAYAPAITSSSSPVNSDALAEQLEEGLPVQKSTSTRRNVNSKECWCSPIKMVIFFAVLVIMALMIALLILLPSPPDHVINNFSVSNFNASYPNFSADWVADLTLKNTNARYKLEFHKIESSVYWIRESFFVSATHLLSSGISKSFSMDAKTSNTMQVKLSANSMDIAKLERKEVEKIAKERGKGAIEFRFAMQFQASYHSKMWRIPRGLALRCDIKVVFEGATGNGKAGYLGHCGHYFYSMI